ncbi:MAG: hypothetical protein WBC44_15370 [Planctomycetaceae bacterium]
MTLMKIALILLGTIGLTAGTVLAVAEPTAEPLPAAVAKASSCGKCGKAAAACKTTPVAVTAATCKTDACSKQARTQKTAAKAACSGDACTKAVSVKDACSKEACATKTVSKDACSKSACATKVSADKPCDRASACELYPVESTICAEETETKYGKDAYATAKCTKAVSATAACDKSKCTEAVSAKAACGASKCTDAVAVTSKCEAAKCEASKCTEAVSTKACAKDACATKACSAECEGKCEGKCDSCPCKAKSDCESKCDKDETVVDADAYRRGTVVGTGVNSNSGIVGKIIFTAKAAAGTCDATKCNAEKGACQGHTVYGIDFSNGLKPSIKRRTVYVENCSRCRETSEVTHDVVATACEAKPACVTNACPVSACATTACASCVCDACRCERCATDADLARNTEPVATTCSSCEQCSCGTCACDSADEARPGFARVGHVRFEQFDAGTGTVLGWSAAQFAPGERHPGYDHHVAPPHHDSMVRFMPEPELPGRVRLRSVVPPHFFHGNMQHFPAGPQFEVPHRGIAMSSFGMPVAATQPPATARHASRNTLEGTWTRTFGNVTISFTIENDRLSGSFGDGGDVNVRFSGMCSISEDGQIVGLIDDVGQLPVTWTGGLIDQPFAVRFRLDGSDLILKDLRCAGLNSEIEYNGQKLEAGDTIRNFACGRYSPSNIE